MRLAIAAFVLAVAALLTDLAVVRPTRRLLEEEEARYEESRSTRGVLRARMLELERRRKAEHAPARDEAVPLREAIVRCLRGRPVRNVRVALQPQGNRMSVSVSGSGALREDLQLLGDLSVRGGITPRALHMAPSSSEVAFSLEGERIP
jgi:hypothetical protein